VLDDGTPAISDTAWDFITSLLREPENRLGSNGVAEIKQHPFFEDLDWDNLLDCEPPFVPKLDSEIDTSYFTAVDIDPSDFVASTPCSSPSGPLSPPGTLPLPLASVGVGPTPLGVQSPFSHLARNSPAVHSPKVHLANFTYNSNLEPSVQARSPAKPFNNHSPRNQNSPRTQNSPR